MYTTRAADEAEFPVMLTEGDDMFLINSLCVRQRQPEGRRGETEGEVMTPTEICFVDSLLTFGINEMICVRITLVMST